MWKPFDSQYEIYPCPFCGYRGLLYRIGSGYVIRCENLACHAEQNVYFTEEAAVHKWNKRIHSIALAAVVAWTSQRKARDRE